MVAQYPTALVTTANIANAGANLSTNPHSSLHDNMRDEIVAIEAELGTAPSAAFSTVTARLNSMWEKFASGAPSAAATFDVTVPASTYELIRIHLFGTVATGSVAMQCRVNNDSTAALHLAYRTSQTATPSESGALDANTGWIVGVPSAAGPWVCELVLWPVTPAASYTSFCNFQSKATNYDGTAAQAISTTTGGKLASARLLSSLRFFPASSTFTGRWIAEGLRL